MKFGCFKSLAQKKEKIDLNAKGFFIKSRSFHVKFSKSEENKAIFIVKKKIGNSPIRNRVKRQIRAILSCKNQLKTRIHLMIIVKKEFLATSFQHLDQEFLTIFTQIEKKFQF